MTATVISVVYAIPARNSIAELREVFIDVIQSYDVTLLEEDGRTRTRLKVGR